MADRGDTHYKVLTLNRWFLWSSLLLLVACVWMVLDDWNSPWKTYQRQFRTIEVERAHAELETQRAQAAMAEEERLSGVLDQKKAELDAKRSELSDAEEELIQARGVQFTATEAAKKAKQRYNWERFIVEEQRLHEGDQTIGEEKLREKENEFSATAGEKELADLAVEEAQARVAALMQGVTNAELAVKGSTKSIDLVRKQLAAMDPDDAPTKIANILRDFPGIDFVGPNLKVKKVVLQDLTFDLNFTTKKRIDMCMTCHVPIDRAGFENEEQPFSSHPRLDLFLSAKSPHPMSSTGCTICHRGSGEALNFQRTDHRPSSEKEGDEWYEEYHWHKQHYWDYPMLSSNHIEGSCVQCHTDSMELIADEAPKVAEGYELFERYACYTCHKVEWFPTQRRPGPPLAELQGKATKDWVASWITNPKSFRPTTWMPQIFHLENYAEGETIVVSEYGSGRAIDGKEWSETAVAAVTQFIWDAAGEKSFPAIPVQGDATRGREVFRLSGCLACHNIAPYSDEERLASTDAAEKLRETNEHGPNLRGVASKVTPEWLYAWVKNPTDYWPETQMPDLRLSDQDAADIVAYMVDDPEGIFQEVPEGWEEADATFDREVLEEQARWFYNRTPRAELTRLFAEDWAEDEVLLNRVGERYVLNQGCHSCHEIPGLEDAQPIGTELTSWASKTVDKLDWGFMHEIIAEEADWPEEVRHHKTLEMKYYKEPWLAQKLAAPRSFDRRKVKNPTEKLRMPWFDFTPEQVDALVTFVGGLVQDEVQQARMVPTAEQAAMDKGLRVMRQKNCASCHVIEPGTVEFDDEDGVRHSVRGRMLALDGEVLPPPMGDYEAYVAEYLAYRREEEDEDYEMEDVIVQLLEPAPGHGDVGEKVFVENLDTMVVEAGWGGDFVDVVTDYYLNPWGYDEETDEDVSLTGDPDGQGRVQDVDGEWRDYSNENYDKVRWTYAPPVLLREGDKLQKDWFYDFLIDPVPLRQQLRVKMPTFRWDEGEAGAVADYFANQAAKEWPSFYARQMLLALDTTPEEIHAGMVEMGLSGTSVAQVQGIADGDSVATAAGLDKLLAYGEAQGFTMRHAVNPNYEAVSQRSPSHLDAILSEDPEFFTNVENLAIKGPNCVQCHFLGGKAPNAEGPLAWAPDLGLSRERLRPDWVRDWLVNPARIYPETAMPANFPNDPANWQDLYEGSGSEQIEAVLTWLYNLDRASAEN